MKPIQRIPKDDQLQIAEIIEDQTPKHQLYHYHICNHIKVLHLLSPNRDAGLPELKEIMCNHWADYADRFSENQRMLIWACHFTISQILVKQRKRNNLPMTDVTEGHSFTPLRNSKDINDYYAFAGVVLMALKETDVATIMCCSAAKLSRILEKQIPIYHSDDLL